MMPNSDTNSVLAEILTIVRTAYTDATMIEPEDAGRLLEFCLEEVRETFDEGHDRAAALDEAAVVLEHVADDVHAMIAALQAARLGRPPLKSDVVRAFGGDGEIPVSGQEPFNSDAYLGRPSVPRS